MPEAAKKNAQWTPVVANTRAIRGAIDACLKLSDQLSDHELKGEAMGFVNEMDYLAAQLLGERTRVKPKRSSENELLQRLRNEVAHIRELLFENDQIAQELGDREASKLLVAAINRANKFAALIEKKAGSTISAR